MKKERLLSIIILVLFIGFNSQLGFSNKIKSDKIDINHINYNVNLLGLVDHAPILIDSNDDFETLNFTGEGTTPEPYLITNLFINASGLTSGIEIRNTGVYFTINNCTILTDYVGIRLESIGGGTSIITNNTCISKLGDGGGITLESMTACTITGNEFANFMQGIHLNNAHYNDIFENNLPFNNFQGINIRYSNHNNVAFNNIQNSQQHGLAFVGTSNYNTVHHNLFINNSKIDEYTIEGQMGIMNSQGYDEGSNNKWYSEDLEYGNLWSDYDGIGSYSIDGPTNAEDIYPQKVSNNESSESVTFAIMTILVTFTTIIVLSKALKKRRKTKSNK